MSYMKDNTEHSKDDGISRYVITEHATSGKDFLLLCFTLIYSRRCNLLHH